MPMMKNINKAEVLVLKDEVAYQEGQVVSKTLAQNDALSVTLFAHMSLAEMLSLPAWTVSDASPLMA